MGQLSADKAIDTAPQLAQSRCHLRNFLGGILNLINWLDTKCLWPWCHKLTLFSALRGFLLRQSLNSYSYLLGSSSSEVDGDRIVNRQSIL